MASPVTTKPVTASDMLAMLKRHYIVDERAPAWVFAPEIQAPGSSGRRADLICLGVTTATGRQLVGHEIKTSRADVLVELADLTKCDPWMQHCDRWWLVIPDLSLIDGLTLPDTWGVMLPPSGRRTRTMTVHRKAPELRPEPQGPAIKTIATWQHWRINNMENAVSEAQRHTASANKRYEDLRLQTVTRDNPAYEVVARIVHALGPVYGDRIGRWTNEIDVEDVIAALTDLGAVYGRRDDAVRVLKQAREGLTSTRAKIDRVLTETQGDVDHDNSR